MWYVFQSTQHNKAAPALPTSARLPLFHRTNWGSANGIMRVGSPHKWSPWWGVGSPSYPLTLFKALPFTVSQTATLRLFQLCCCPHRSCAQGTGWHYTDGISLCSKKMKFLSCIFLRLFLKRRGFMALYILRQTGRIKVMSHMRTQKIPCLG